MMRELARRARAKLAADRGETLVETLVATLILAGVMLMLCAAIVAAARVNTTLEPKDTVFDASSAVSGPAVTISVSSDEGDSATPTADSYTENGYLFYAPRSSN